MPGELSPASVYVSLLPVLETCVVVAVPVRWCSPGCRRRAGGQVALSIQSRVWDATGSLRGCEATTWLVCYITLASLSRVKTRVNRVGILAVQCCSRTPSALQTTPHTSVNSVLLQQQCSHADSALQHSTQATRLQNDGRHARSSRLFTS